MQSIISKAHTCLVDSCGLMLRFTLLLILNLSQIKCIICIQINESQVYYMRSLLSLLIQRLISSLHIFSCLLSAWKTAA